MPENHDGLLADGLDPRRWAVLFVVLAAAFMVLLDTSIVNVAIPSIQRDLHATFGQVQLVVALYQLSYAVVLITGGRLGDIFGRKLLFTVGMAGFVVASLLCGLAQSPEILVGARVFQGLMASLMYPQVLSVIQVLFPPKERPKALAAFGAVIGLATVAGPLVGGILIQLNVAGWEWRPIFLVNLPVGCAALVASFFLLRETRSPTAPRLDLVGVVIVSSGLFLLVWPLVEGRDAGWPTWAYVCLIASLPVMILFVLFERRQNARNASPLLVFKLFRHRSFNVGSLITFLLLAGIPSFFLTFTIFVQIGLGFSALHAGLTTLPFSVGIFIASVVSARLADRLGRTILIVGNVLLVAGIISVLVTVHLAGPELNSLQLIPSFVVCGLGVGSVIAPLLNVILAGVDPRDAGSASGVGTTLQQLGGAVGVAVIGVIFFGLLAGQSRTVARQLSPGLERTLVQLHVPPSAEAGIVAEFQRCFHDRLSEKDPTVAPPSCRVRGQTNPAVARILTRTGGAARKEDFVDSFNWSLLFNIGVWSATLLLLFALPQRSPAAAGELQGS